MLIAECHVAKTCRRLPGPVHRIFSPCSKLGTQQQHRSEQAGGLRLLCQKLSPQSSFAFAWDAMARARIITRCAEEAQGLAAQLHARGYTVEIVSPGQVADTPPDLEISLEECSVDEALSQAQLSAEKDLSVVIAPGAVAGMRPLAEIPFINSVNPEDIVRESERAIDPRTAQSVEEPEVYVYQDAMLSPLQRLRLPRIRFPKFSRPRLSWPLPRVRLPRPEISFHLPNLSLPRVRLRVRKPALRLPHFSWPQRALHLPIKIRLRPPSFRVPTPEFRIPRPALRILQIAWRMPRFAIPKFSLPVVRSRRSNALFWDSTVAFAILAVSVLMVGGLLHSRTPMPAYLTQQSENPAQPVSFGKTKTVSPNPAPATRTIPATRAVPDDQPNANPLAAPALAGQRKPSPQVHRNANLSPRAFNSQQSSGGEVKVARRSQSTADDGGYVADDVVIHYGSSGKN